MLREIIPFRIRKAVRSKLFEEEIKRREKP